MRHVMLTVDEAYVKRMPMLRQRCPFSPEVLMSPTQAKSAPASNSADKPRGGRRVAGVPAESDATQQIVAAITAAIGRRGSQRRGRLHCGRLGRSETQRSARQWGPSGRDRLG